MSRELTAARRRLTALRMSALGIARPSAASPLAAVKHLLALQGQDYAGALWSIGLRTPGSTVASVEEAHHRGDLVRTWPFRGTLHVVAAEDARWMVDVTADRTHAAAATRYRRLELTEADFERAERIARERLHGGARLERAQLLAAFDEEGLNATGQRGAHLLVRLAQSGVAVLCAQNTWTLLDEHVPMHRELDRDQGLAEIARRHLDARGPATDRDLAWWAGISLTRARAAIAAVADEFDRLELEGTTYLLRPGLEEAPDGVHVLPGFDEYLLGYTDRSAPLAGRPLETVVPGGNGMFLSTIVVNGEIVGTWRRTVKARHVEIVAQPFGRLSASARTGFARATRGYGDYLGLSVRFPED